MAVNRPRGRNDYYASYEGSITRRLADSWSLLAAYTATKYHRYLVNIPQSPNDDYFDLDDKWRWNVKLNGNYNFPKAITVGGIVQVLNGAYGQRTYVFRATDASGPPLRQLAQQSIRLEPFGAQQEAAQVDLQRAAREACSRWGGKRLNLAVDALNVTNANAPTAATYVSGRELRSRQRHPAAALRALRRDLRLLARAVARGESHDSLVLDTRPARGARRRRRPRRLARRLGQRAAGQAVAAAGQSAPQPHPWLGAAAR